MISKKLRLGYVMFFQKMKKGLLLKKLLIVEIFFFVDNFAKVSNSSKTIRQNKIDDSKDNTLILIGANHIKNIYLTKLKNIKILIFDDEKKIKKKVNLDIINIKNHGLNKLFLNFNCDKGSHYFELESKFKSHNYSSFYEKTFKHLKHKEFNMLELGGYKGASTASFNKYFKKSFITVIDINKEIFKYFSKRIKFLKASYLDNLFLKKFLKRNEKFFDIVIDDGDHSKSHILKNLKNFILTVKPEGHYVIEDLGFQENFNHKNDLKDELSILSILKKFKEKKIFKSKIFSVQDQIDLMKIIDEITIYKGNMKKNGLLVSIIAFIKIKSKENLLKSQNLIIKPMEIINLNKNFIHKMNLKKTNEFTQIKNKKQNFKTSFQYFMDRIKNNELYYSINNLKGDFFGTLTMREISNQQAYFGILVFEKKFLGTFEIKVATNIFLDFCFKKFKLKSIKGRTYIKNKSANFNLIINNFNVIEEMGPLWELQVTKKEFKKYYSYDVI